MGVGPATKETTLHHFQDPLLQIVQEDPEVELLGVILVGTPQSDKEKAFVGARVAVMIERIGTQGVLFSLDGWGNSHVDYENTFRELGEREIPTVGLTFIGIQGALVVKNSYMQYLVDINKSKEGIETEVLGENSVSLTDAKKALAMLKLKMRGTK